MPFAVWESAKGWFHPKNTWNRAWDSIHLLLLDIFCLMTKMEGKKLRYSTIEWKSVSNCIPLIDKKLNIQSGLERRKNLVEEYIRQSLLLMFNIERRSISYLWSFRNGADGSFRCISSKNYSALETFRCNEKSDMFYLPALLHHMRPENSCLSSMFLSANPFTFCVSVESHESSSRINQKKEIRFSGNLLINFVFLVQRKI